MMRLRFKGGARYYQYDLTQTIRINEKTVIIDKDDTKDGLCDIITGDYIPVDNAFFLNNMIYDVNGLFVYIMYKIFDNYINPRANPHININSIIDPFRQPITPDDILLIIIKHCGFSNISALFYFLRYESTPIPKLHPNITRELFSQTIRIIYNSESITKRKLYKAIYNYHDLSNTVVIDYIHYIRDKDYPLYPLLNVLSNTAVKPKDAYILHSQVYNKNELLIDILKKIESCFKLGLQPDRVTFWSNIKDYAGNIIKKKDIIYLLLATYNMKSLYHLLLYIKRNIVKLGLLGSETIFYHNFFTTICYLYLSTNLDKYRNIYISSKITSDNTYRYFKYPPDNTLPKNSIIIGRFPNNNVDYIITHIPYVDKFPISLFEQCRQIIPISTNMLQEGLQIIEIIPAIIPAQKLSLYNRNIRSTRRNKSY